MSNKIDGIGIINTKNPIGKKRTFRWNHPSRKSIIPVTITKKENRMVKLSEARCPISNNMSPKRVTIRP